VVGCGVCFFMCMYLPLLCCVNHEVCTLWHEGGASVHVCVRWWECVIKRVGVEVVMVGCVIKCVLSV
jgi:hypothetical protein